MSQSDPNAMNSLNAVDLITGLPNSPAGLGQGSLYIQNGCLTAVSGIQAMQNSYVPPPHVPNTDSGRPRSKYSRDRHWPLIATIGCSFSGVMSILAYAGHIKHPLALIPFGLLACGCSFASAIKLHEWCDELHRLRMMFYMRTGERV